MASIAEHLAANARQRLAAATLKECQHLRDVLVEVEADDLAALVAATPDNLPAGPARQARDSWAVSSVASAGRLVAVRADHLEALATVAIANDQQSQPQPPASVAAPDDET